MDSITQDDVEYITLIFASQTGKSELLFNSVGYFADLDPCPIMMVQPTVDMAQAVSKDRITPLFRDSPSLAAKSSHGANQTILQKQFPGGHLTLVGANAPAGLASRPIRIVLADECDRFPASAGGEGDPILLAVRRTASFPHNKKILLTSTPTLKGISRIEKAWNESDQRHYHIPCPHCEVKQVLKLEQIKYEDDNPDTARYVCENADCAQPWTEAERLDALQNGEWIAARPWITSHRGYHLSGLYSPWYRMRSIIKEYLSAKKDPAQYRTFVNTVLAEPYADETDHIEESDIIKRMEPYGLDLIPEDALAITAGVDVQQDRAEVSLYGWGEDVEYILGHVVIYGDPTGTQLWEKLTEFLSSDFQHALGGRLKIDATAVDSGNWSQQVYRYAGANKHLNVYAIKGVGGERLMWEASKSKVKHTKLYLVGSDTAKTNVMAKLKQHDKTKIPYIHIPEMGDQSESFANQLLSEFREVTFLRGFPSYTWHRKPGRRAEVLDCVAYATAVREAIKPNWEMRRDRLTVNVAAPKKQAEGWGDIAAMFD